MTKSNAEGAEQAARDKDNDLRIAEYYHAAWVLKAAASGEKEDWDRASELADRVARIRDSAPPKVEDEELSDEGRTCELCDGPVRLYNSVWVNIGSHSRHNAKLKPIGQREEADKECPECFGSNWSRDSDGPCANTFHLKPAGGQEEQPAKHDPKPVADHEFAPGEKDADRCSYYDYGVRCELREEFHPEPPYIALKCNQCGRTVRAHRLIRPGNVCHIYTSNGKYCTGKFAAAALPQQAACVFRTVCQHVGECEYLCKQGAEMYQRLTGDHHPALPQQEETATEIEMAIQRIRLLESGIHWALQALKEGNMIPFVAAVREGLYKKLFQPTPLLGQDEPNRKAP